MVDICTRSGCPLTGVTLQSGVSLPILPSPISFRYSKRTVWGTLHPHPFRDANLRREKVSSSPIFVGSKRLLLFMKDEFDPSFLSGSLSIVILIINKLFLN